MELRLFAEGNAQAIELWLVYRIMRIASNRSSYEYPGHMEKAAQQASPVPTRQPRIVIADDFEMLRRGLKSLLGPAICGEAENGQQAVERVKELRPDIVILDWTMPVMNGLQAAQMIRSLAPETKIIVFSLHDGNTVREEALRAGADVFLHKTATGEEILKTIAALMGTFPERSIPATSAL
jgi:DNA-binding NarL/FixJ family response regulator